ncbi:hypothetical protein [Bradyrhizobium cenepequi]|uniref:hypothetical protein n=1 Tax=Bradyrhizobium cenepequi TaxID=2821403 RepID=UPI001CE35A47|nr:hypothetical protein [Bradyrhizobium cenepequi]MCA6106401.1 hypothetical protein [Bradyrhizobium cenepequi]
MIRIARKRDAAAHQKASRKVVLCADGKSADDRDRWSQLASASSRCNTRKITFHWKHGNQPMRIALVGVSPVSFQGRFFQ